MTTFVPVEPFPPGEYIKDEMEARGWTHADLADVMGISRRQVINLIQGKSGITPDTAHSLADAFDQDAQTWMNLQVSYELALAAQKERSVKRRARIFDKVPVREIRRRGWIANVEDTDELEQEVCRFLRIESITDSVCFPVAARKSTSYSVETSAQQAWYRRAWELAEHAPASRFDANSLNDAIPDLLELAAYPEDARRIPMVLAEMGIRFVVIQHLKGSKIDGVAFWLDAKSPAIALSMRYDRIDNLWFTLMHELMHIVNGDKATPVDEDLLSRSSDLPEIEIRANQQAAERLIPQKKLDSFISRVGPYFYRSRINQFAQARNVHPGIVVGQLHYRDEIKYNQLRPLLVKVKEYLLESALADGWGNTPTF